MNSGKKLVNALSILLVLLPLSVLFAVIAFADGASVYNTYCAGCHRLGTYDTTGTAPDLYQKGSLIDSKYTAGVSGHKGITLTATNITELKAFVNNPSTPTTPLAISTATLPGATVGAAYSQTLSATGGVPPYTWSYSGTLPAGIGLTSAGSITGTPTTSGAFSFTARVADSKSAAVTKALSITIAAAASTPMSTSDKNLFVTNCMSCHTPYGLQNRTAAQIQTAINSNDHGMGTRQLRSLSSIDINAIARSLAPTTPPTMDCNTCHASSTPSPTPTPTPTTGQTVYDSKCAGCHRLGTYDTTGTAPDLSGKGSLVDSYYTAGVSGHKGITLSATDITNLKTFVNSY